MHLLDESISNHAKLCTNPVLQLIEQSFDRQEFKGCCQKQYRSKMLILMDFLKT